MSFKEVVEAIRNMHGTVLVLTHHNADIDAMASAVALSQGLSQLGLDTSIGVAESVAKVAKKVVGDVKILINPDCSKYDNVILVDTSVPEQLAAVKNLRADIIIDHHPAGPLVQAAKVVCVEPFSRSTAQIVYSLLKDMDCTVDKSLATVLAAGIVADTAHLRFAGLPEFEVLTELLRIGADYGEVLSLLTTPADPSDIIAGLKAASRMQLWKVDDILIAISKLGSHEAPAARALQKLGADIAIVAAIKEDEVRISSRASDRIAEYEIDLSEIFNKVGELIGGTGGGHPTAGSANGTDTKAVDNAFEFILKAISKKVGKPYKKLD
ncbi:MAG: DHH family phosphoesterase [Candidatus Aenigmatarchaeota archaeon]|nr:DHH family phosphoesterase [Candidatus Aenigmarchaeota archaeon]